MNTARLLSTTLQIIREGVLENSFSSAILIPCKLVNLTEEWKKEIELKLKVQVKFSLQLQVQNSFKHTYLNDLRFLNY